MSSLDTPYGPIAKTLLMQLKQIKLLACDLILLAHGQLDTIHGASI